MKSTVKFDGRGRRTARQLQELIAVAFSSAIAVRYCLAARQDEKDGFPFTAAMEWRKAAELFAPIALMSYRCWHEWERIMHLPRHMADPIGAFSAAQDSLPTPHIEAVTVTVPNELPLPLLPKCAPVHVQVDGEVGLRPPFRFPQRFEQGAP